MIESDERPDGCARRAVDCVELSLLAGLILATVAQIALLGWAWLS